jgi:MFS/sugar transport protein
MSRLFRSSSPEIRFYAGPTVVAGLCPVIVRSEKQQSQTCGESVDSLATPYFVIRSAQPQLQDSPRRFSGSFRSAVTAAEFVSRISFAPGASLEHKMGPLAAARPTAATECLSRTKLICATLGMLGQSVGWSIQIGYTSRTLLQLHLPDKYVSLAWLAGPISGMLVQPIIGVLSDRCTSPLGRRRPFLIGGTVCTVISLWCFAYARAIGASIGVSPLVIAISSFWLLDFAMNASTFADWGLTSLLTPIESLSRFYGTDQFWYGRVWLLLNLISPGASSGLDR